MSLLNATNISYGFGDRIILKNATFRLLKGEHIGLVGANGEGKSTFINLLMGKELPEEGKIEWAKHLKVGYLDQFSSLTKGMTIRDTLKTAFIDMFKLEEEINNLYMTMGDMTWELYWVSNKYAFDEYKRDINKIKGIQVFNTIGNHDHEMAKGVVGDFDTVIKYKKTIAPTYYSFNIGKVHYIVLDDINCKNTGRAGSGPDAGYWRPSPG